MGYPWQARRIWDQRMLEKVVVQVDGWQRRGSFVGELAERGARGGDGSG
jgi:hypothetical protein